MHEASKKLLDFHIEGNIVPISWYVFLKKIVWDRKSHTYKESDQVDHLAIAILADILYWYRPVEIRDERTGQLLGYKNKFKGTSLQKTYQEYAELFKAPKSTIKRAVDNLCYRNLIRRSFETIKTQSGITMCNVMYLEPNISEIKKITHPRNLINTPLEDSDTSSSHTNTHPSVNQKDIPLSDKRISPCQTEPYVSAKQEDMSGSHTGTYTQNTNIDYLHRLPTQITNRDNYIEPSYEDIYIHTPEEEKENLDVSSTSVEETLSCTCQEARSSGSFSSQSADNKKNSTSYKEKNPSKERCLSSQRKNKASSTRKKTAGRRKKDNIPYEEIISYLNQKTGKNFKATTKATRRLIHARWSEGFRLGDFKKVIDNKTADWKDDPHMSKYLRPQTLFNTKFEAYLNETPHKTATSKEKKNVSFQPPEDIPYEEIADLYNEILPDLPPVSVLNRRRKSLIAERWMEAEERQNLSWWKDFFMSIRDCPLLLGRVLKKGQTPFKADFDWIMNEEHFTHIIEGRYSGPVVGVDIGKNALLTMMAVKSYKTEGGWA